MVPGWDYDHLRQQPEQRKRHLHDARAAYPPLSRRLRLGYDEPRRRGVEVGCRRVSDRRERGPATDAGRVLLGARLGKVTKGHRLEEHPSHDNGSAPRQGLDHPRPHPRIGATVTDKQTDLAKEDLRLILDGTKVPGTEFSYDQTTDRLRYTPVADLAAGRHVVKVLARDPEGLVGRKVWSFSVRP